MPVRTSEPVTLGEVLSATRASLAPLGTADAGLDARLIVEHFSATGRVDSIARPAMPLAPEVVAAIGSAVARRLAGEPVYRILGFREFHGLRLSLSPATLEPRPDTETLVDAMLPFLRMRAENAAPRILDLGTGTGALALALLASVPQATAVGSDVVAEVLATAMANAAELGMADRFSAVKSDWWERIDGVYDAIVSNPPYIRSEVIPLLAPEVRDFDPVTALDGGTDGLAAYRRIAAGAQIHLAPGGRIGVEIGQGQGSEVAEVFTDAGFASVSVHRDLGGHDRAMIFMR